MDCYGCPVGLAGGVVVCREDEVFVVFLDEESDGSDESAFDGGADGVPSFF